MRNPFDLTGKVAIVTGSSRGIGRAIAELYAQLGAKVVVSSRKAEACDEVTAGIRAAGGEATTIACNISRKGEVEGLVRETERVYGPIDVMCCNAAINPVYGPMSQLTDEALDKIMHANVKSTLWFCNLVMPKMAERGGGSVIIVSSIGGLRGSDVIGAYNVSKAADFQLARNLAVEWGPKNVRINCIAPGLVKTDFAKALWEDEKAVAFRNRMTPLRRIGEPHEIAPAAAFLAGDGSSFMTGQAIVVDGGVTIG